MLNGDIYPGNYFAAFYRKKKIWIRFEEIQYRYAGYRLKSFRNYKPGTGTPGISTSFSELRSESSKKFWIHNQCFGSGSAMDPDSMASWIRIHIPNADPDPGGNKRNKMKGKTQPKDR
jgi:hypothetical protein